MTLRVSGPFGRGFSFPVLFGVLFLLISGGVLSAQQAVGEDEAAALVGDFRDAVYLQQTGDEALARQFRLVRADLGDQSLTERQELFWRAQATYYMARGYQSLDSVQAVLDQDEDLRKGRFKRLQKSYARLDDVIAHYEEALALMDTYLEGGRDARGVRLYAENLSQLSTLKSLGFLMSNGTKISPLAEEALELNPGEVKAHLLLASRYVYSPGIWGGDPDRGISMLEEVKTMDGLDREDVHNIAVAIGFAHTMAGRWSDAVPFFEEALKVYPTNIYAKAMLQLSRSGGS